MAGVCRGLEAVPSSARVDTTSITIARNNTTMAGDDGVDGPCAPRRKGVYISLYHSINQALEPMLYTVLYVIFRLS